MHILKVLSLFLTKSTGAPQGESLSRINFVSKSLSNWCRTWSNSIVKFTSFFGGNSGISFITSYTRCLFYARVFFLSSKTQDRQASHPLAINFSALKVEIIIVSEFTILALNLTADPLSGYMVTAFL